MVYKHGAHDVVARLQNMVRDAFLAVRLTSDSQTAQARPNAIRSYCSRVRGEDRSVPTGVLRCTEDGPLPTVGAMDSDRIFPTCPSAGTAMWVSVLQSQQTQELSIITGTIRPSNRTQEQIGSSQ